MAGHRLGQICEVPITINPILGTISALAARPALHAIEKESEGGSCHNKAKAVTLYVNGGALLWYHLV